MILSGLQDEIKSHSRILWICFLKKCFFIAQNHLSFWNSKK